MRHFVAGLLLMSVAGLQAHSLHQTTAEAEYNVATQKLEISLTVFINDLELALIRQTERRISFDTTPQHELDAAIHAYLVQTLVLTDSQGQVAKLEWVGREAEASTAKSSDPTATLFLQVALPHGLSQAQLRHAVFTELFADQVNLMCLKNAALKKELKFTPAAQSQTLPST